MREAVERLIHFHIFKNAGTSVDIILDRYFGKGHISIEGSSSNDVIPSYCLKRRLDGIGPFNAVSTHLGRPGQDIDDYIPIVFLRDPIDRARSVYRFVRQDSTQPGHAAAASRSFRDFIDWSLSSQEDGVVIRDYQTIHLSDASFRSGHILQAKAEQRDLDQAIALLSRWEAVGVTRRFAQSLRRFNAAYGDRFPGLFTGEVCANVTKAGYVSDRTEWAEARLELGPALFERLVEANVLDIALHRWAVQRLA